MANFSRKTGVWNEINVRLKSKHGKALDISEKSILSLINSKVDQWKHTLSHSENSSKLELKTILS